MKNKLLRILLLPIGFVKALVDLANNYARDIENNIRFKGSRIDKLCTFSKDTRLKHSTHILEKCVINNSSIDSYTYVNKNCLIQNAKIGKFCSIGADVIVGTGTHPSNLLSTSPIFYKKHNTLNICLQEIPFKEYSQITIGNDVWIGTRAIIMDGVTIGDGAIIAAGAVVTKDVAPYAIIGGVPGKLIKYRFNSDTVLNLLKSKWWDMNISDLKDFSTQFQ